MSAQPIESPPPTTYAAKSDNRLAVQTLIDRLDLPAPTLVARADVVHICLADVDDFGKWVHALGGSIERGVTNGGASTWTLSTFTPLRADLTAVRVRVHCTVVDGEDVIADLYGAVTK
jgi:hypothetical protein